MFATQPQRLGGEKAWNIELENAELKRDLLGSLRRLGIRPKN